MEDWKKNYYESFIWIRFTQNMIGIHSRRRHYLEQEMALFIDGGVDVLVFDGTEGGTLYNDGKEKHQYNPEKGAITLSNYFISCVEEMRF